MRSRFPARISSSVNFSKSSLSVNSIMPFVKVGIILSSKYYLIGSDFVSNRKCFFSSILAILLLTLALVPVVAPVTDIPLAPNPLLVAACSSLSFLCSSSLSLCSLSLLSLSSLSFSSSYFCNFSINAFSLSSLT